MDIYALLNLFSAIATLYFTISIVITNPRNPITRAFVYLSLSFIGWDITIFYVHYVESEIIFRLLLFFLFSIGILYLRFIYKFTSRNFDKAYYINFIIAAISIGTTVFTHFVVSSWRLTPYGLDISLGPLFYPAGVISGLIPVLYGLYILWDYRKKTDIPMLKEAVNMVFFGTFIMTFLLFIFDILFISILDMTWLPSAATFTFIPALFFYIAIKKYEFLNLKPETALSRLFEYLGEGAAILDRNGKVIAVNPKLVEITGKSPKKLIGKNVRLSLKEFDETKDYTQYEVHSNGKTYRVSQTKIKSKGITIGYIMLVYDITERVLMEEELRQAKEEAYQAMNAERRFISNMSHEIRTPLNGIIVTLDLVEEENLTPTQKEYLSIIRTQAKALLEIVNEILDLARIREGKLTLREEEFDMEKVFCEIIEIIKNDVYKKELEFYPYIDPQIFHYIIGDSEKVKEILMNLLGNAIKFTEKGAIWFSILKKKEDKENIKIRFVVKDTGIGIPEDKINKIFESFIQLDMSDKRRYGGTGLGLAIVKELVNLMHGEIKVESAPKKGSTFYIDIEFKKGKEKGKLAPVSLPFREVIVISDNTYTHEFLETILKEIGIKSIISLDLEEFLKIQDGYKKEKNRIFLLDVMGKRKEREIGVSPILGLVSPSLLHVLKDYKSFIDAYLLKPIRRDTLKEKLANLNTPLPEKEIIRKEEKENYTFSKNYKILLVEDNKVNQEVEGLLLKKMGLSFDIASNGTQALELFSKNKYDLILMDVQMPVMDGIEATKRIREMEKKTGSHVPILALSASVFESEIREFLDAGMDGFIPKPVTYKALYNALFGFLEMSYSKDKYYVFSPDILIEDLGDEETLRTILANNFENIKELVLRYKESWEKGDVEGLRTAVHKLRGAIGNIIHPELKKELLNLNTTLREKDIELSSIETTYKNIEKKLEQFLEELEGFLNR